MMELIIQKIVSVYLVDLDTATYYNTNRPYSAMCLKTSGHSIYTQNGIDYYSDSKHLILIPKGSTYSYSVKEKGSCIIIEFMADGLPDTITAHEVNNGDVIKGIAANMEYAWTFKRPGYREICLSGIYQLLYHMMLHESNTYLPRVHRTKIDKSLHYIHDHFCDHSLTIQDLAHQSEISVIYFRKIFHEVFGVSPKKYITLLRLNRAKELLTANELSISQIAEVVGFGDIYSFCKTFRTETGTTPTEYKKGIQAGKDMQNESNADQQE